MGKWKPNTKEFTVGINFNETRGFQSSIPRPITDFLELDPNDKIDWIMKESTNGNRYAIVKKFDNYDESSKITTKYSKRKQQK